MTRKKKQPDKSNWKKNLYTIIFNANTFYGKSFDVILLISILLSIIVIMLESVSELKVSYGRLFYVFEWFFTILFTLEYIARIIVIDKPKKYVLSFFGIVDLLSIIPTYLSFFIVGAQSLLVIRSLRLFRVFRVFKLMRFMGEASQLSTALKASRAKITVFIGAVFILVVLLGTLMYLIESGENGFTSIPRSIYWAIVTLTTVGYGDIAPQTVLGQAIASFVMILGYGIIAVPTGIITSEMAKKGKNSNSDKGKNCSGCTGKGHDKDAVFCKFCGSELL